MNTLLLLILAITPSFILLYFILFMDRHEKEPLGLVIKIILLGAMSVAPAIVMEYLMGMLPIYSHGKVMRAVMISFVQVAWVEELCKLGVVLLFAWNNKNFNEENDGIVYVGSSAIGFAMLENIFYVLSFGMWVGILRSITAMPLHCFSGVLMGYFVGRAKFSSTSRSRTKNILKGFLLAYILHGVYDTLLLTRTNSALLAFPMVFILIIFGIKFIKKGRALSLIRAETLKDESTQIDIQAEMFKRSNPENQFWKIIVSRVLLSLSGIFWILIFIGLVASYEKFKYKIFDAIMGGIILSFLPILIGVLLEISFRRNKMFFKHLKETYPHIQTIERAEDITPPGQAWKIFISRTLFTLIGLFWAILILGFIAKFEKYGSRWFDVLFGGTVLSAIPFITGFLLETSYRKKRDEYRKSKRMTEEFNKSKFDPFIPVYSDNELHDYCQKLKKNREKEEFEERKKKEGG